MPFLFLVGYCFQGMTPGAPAAAAAPPPEPEAVRDTAGLGSAAPDSPVDGAAASSIPSSEPYFGLVVRRYPVLYEGSRALEPGNPRVLLTHPIPLAPLTRYAQPTRFQSGVLGADKGAFAGMALGFLGMEAGFWEEPTAWYLMGAGAALGAIWGGVLGSENATIQLRVEPDR